MFKRLSDSMHITFVQVMIAVILFATTMANISADASSTQDAKIPATTLPQVEAQVPVDDAMIQQWIVDLSSEHTQVRHAAVKNLLSAGDAALSAIKAALKGSTTPEERHLLRDDIRKTFRHDAIRGPLITLDVKNAPAEKVFEMVCKQAGTTANFTQQNTMIPFPLNLPEVTLHVKDVPFWQIMQRLAAMTGVSPAVYYNNGPGIALAPNGLLSGQDIISFDGEFAITTLGIRHIRSLTFTPGNQQPRSAFSVNACLLYIPGKTGPIQIEQAILSKAVDNRGNSLLGTPLNNLSYGGQYGGMSNIIIPLQWPKKPGTQIAILKGYVPIIVPYSPSYLDLNLKTKGMTRASIHGVKVAAGNVKYLNGNWQFTFTVKPPSNGMNMTPTVVNIVNQLGNFYNGPIHNAAGAVINPNGYTTSGNWQHGTTYTIPIQNGDKPAKIIMPIYTRQQPFKVRFDFKNIPMP